LPRADARFDPGRAYRPVAAVIQAFVYPQAWTEQLLWASVLIFLLTRGPGPISLDHFIERAYGRGRPA